MVIPTIKGMFEPVCKKELEVYSNMLRFVPLGGGVLMGVTGVWTAVSEDKRALKVAGGAWEATGVGLAVFNTQLGQWLAERIIGCPVSDLVPSAVGLTEKLSMQLGDALGMQASNTYCGTMNLSGSAKEAGANSVEIDMSSLSGSGHSGIKCYGPPGMTLEKATTDYRKDLREKIVAGGTPAADALKKLSLGELGSQFQDPFHLNKAVLKAMKNMDPPPVLDQPVRDIIAKAGNINKGTVMDQLEHHENPYEKAAEQVLEGLKFW